MKIAKSIKEYYTEIHLPAPKYEFFHVGKHEDNMRTIKKIQSPIKHNLYSISLTSTHNGELSINYNQVKYRLFIISPFKVIKWDITGQQIEGLYIIFDHDCIRSNPLWKNFIADFSFFRHENLLTGEVPDSLNKTIFTYFQQIYLEYYTPGPGQFDIIRCYVHTILLLLKRHCDNKTDSLLNELNGSSRILGDLEALLLEAMSTKELNLNFRKPSYYAAKLNLHTNRLNTIMKLLTGKTTSAYIQDHIIQQAGLLIRQTNMPVKEIASRFHFSQPTHFVLFFRKQTGQTPRQFKISDAVV